jgi:hypothetical protein
VNAERCECTGVRPFVAGASKACGGVTVSAGKTGGGCYVSWKGLGWAAAIAVGVAAGPLTECETRGVSECSEVNEMQVR